MYRIKVSFLILITIAVSNTVLSQATMTNNDPDADFKLAKELFQKEQFSLAYPLFKTLALNNYRNSKTPVAVQLESKYYGIVSGLKLNDEIAVTEANDFINLEHDAAHTEMMSFHLGEYYFRQQRYADAIEFYDRAGIANLSNREIADMKFHKGYGYFATQQMNQAKPLFNSIRQIKDDPNYVDANYYYGFISFYEKNYPEALTSIRIVENQPSYTKIVPYYVAQIYYFQGEKDQAIDYALNALEKGGQYYDLQLRQLIGHAYFEQKLYEKALPFLEEYVSKTEKVRREDLYELSYCYYETKQYQKAITGFKELGGKQDSLAQNSMYLLADSYLKTNQKASARNAFLFCALNSSNAAQKEVSQFHYAKLSYELGFTNVALTELQQFTGQYPRSTYINEARELLVQALAGTNQYKDALALFKTLSSPNETLQRVYPRILYGRAAELVNDQQLNEADVLLNELMVTRYNNAQLPFANFWKGEIAYRFDHPDSAITYLQTYLENPQTNGEVNPDNARYTLGYAYLKTEDFKNAQNSFNAISATASLSSTPLQQDAFVRNADANFMMKNYSRALNMYDEVIAKNLPNADYALYQKAIISGASNKNAEKISLLNTLPARYPSSQMIPDAYMEIANTYISNEQYREALTPLGNVLKAKNAEGFKPQAYLRTGVAYFNLEDNNQAIDNFKKLISGYPNSPESDAAIEYVRSIFIEQQKPGEFVAFMRQSGKAVSFSEEDSLTYVSAQIRYESKDAENALRGFTEYAAEFPNGKYFVDANFNAAEIYNSRKDFANALKYYAVVASKAPNKFAERSVLQAARISYFELKDYAASETYFTQLKSLATTAENKLEGMRGLLRVQFKNAKWAEAVPNANELLQQKGIATDDKMMANLVIGKNYQLNNQLPEALSAYRSVVALGKSEFSAEARYHIAEILVAQNALADAEKAAFEVVNKSGSYDYWITKAYILLGEIYFRQQDYFNAEATLKSVVENAITDELKKEAQQKLDIVVAEKNSKSKIDQ
jgi:tetratricopeptide (TPR) repeat protein